MPRENLNHFLGTPSWFSWMPLGFKNSLQVEVGQSKWLEHIKKRAGVLCPFTLPPISTGANEKGEKYLTDIVADWNAFWKQYLVGYLCTDIFTNTWWGGLIFGDVQVFVCWGTGVGCRFNSEPISGWVWKWDKTNQIRDKTSSIKQTSGRARQTASNTSVDWQSQVSIKKRPDLWR